MAFDEGLAQRIREHWEPSVSFDEKRMFGGLAFMVRGHMAVGVSGSRLMARVGPAWYDQALRLPHVNPMDITGRPMRGLVIVLPEGLETDAQLAAWLDRSKQWVDTLPDKP